MLELSKTSAVIGLLAMFAPGTLAGQEIVGQTRCLPGLHQDQARGWIALPDDALFCPLLADPKQPRSFVSGLRSTLESSTDDTEEDITIGAIGIGDEIGLLRSGRGSGNAVQLNLDAAVFAQFDLGTSSYDLINADYVVGLPLAIRFSGFGARFRVYHQSSHLGDEFLLRSEHPERENLSFEALQLILSQEIGALRLYGGGELLFNREPEDLAAKLVQGGVEVRAGTERVRWVAAADAKSSEEHDWKVAISARSGVELTAGTRAGHPGRVWAVLAEFYSGPSPYGQFFREQMRYVGVGLHLRP
jgi:hypothetical protein